MQSRDMNSLHQSSPFYTGVANGNGIKKSQVLADSIKKNAVEGERSWFKDFSAAFWI
jgi:hypothetical protein